MFAQLELIVLLTFVDDFLFFKVLLRLSCHVLSRLVQLRLHLLSPLPLTLVCLLVLDDFTLALVYDLQEEVLHEAQGLLVLFVYLDGDVVIIAHAHPFELLLQGRRVFENILYLSQPILGLGIVLLHLWLQPDRTDLSSRLVVVVHLYLANAHVVDQVSTACLYHGV